MNNEIIIYTDGACSGNPGSGGWAAVIIYPGGRLEEFGGGEKNTTNNRMEMSAAIAALAAVSRYLDFSLDKGTGNTTVNDVKIRIYTDSSLLLNGITKWIWGWMRRDWVNSAGEPVANKELWIKLWSVAAPLRGKTEWIHVKGHAGHSVNERCDTIAVSYSKNNPVKLYSGPVSGCGYPVLPPSSGEIQVGKSVTAVHSSPENEKDKFYISMVNGVERCHKTWAGCEAAVKGKKGARFKKVYSQKEAEECFRKWKSV